MTLLIHQSRVANPPAETAPPDALISETPAPIDGATVARAEDTLQTLRARLENQLAHDENTLTAEARSYQDRVRHRLTQVKIAQARLHEGTYGTCIDCRQPIEGERLFAQPFTTRCTRCQTIAEWRGFSY